MKTLVIVAIVGAFLGYCVKLAWDNREAKKEPVVSEGLTYKITEDRFESGLNRYELRVQLNKELSKDDAAEIGAWIARTHNESDAFIVFFDVLGKKGAVGRLDLPSGKYEVIEPLPF